MTTDVPITLTNPADRILKLLVAAKQITAPNILEGFSKLFGVVPRDLPGIYRRLSIASQETVHVDNLLKISGNSDLEQDYEVSKGRILNFFSPNRFDTQWEPYRNSLKEEDLTILRICSRLINRSTAENVISSAALKSVLDSVEALRKDVLTASIDPKLRAILLENLRRIETAIIDYDVRGVEGLQEAAVLVGLNVSSLIETHKPREQEKVETPGEERKEEKENAVWIYIQRLAQITTILIGLSKAANAIVPLLPQMKDTFKKIEQMVPAKSELPPVEPEPQGRKSHEIQQT